MKIHHLSCGSFCPPCAAMFTGEGSLINRTSLCCHCILIETRRGLVLIDTGIGIGPHGESDYSQMDFRLSRAVVACISQIRQNSSGTAYAKIKSLGFDPSDVRHIVLTHLDYDHSGGLKDFPDANVHVAKREYQAAFRRDGKGDPIRYWQHQFSHNPKWQRYRYSGESWYGFGGVRAIKGFEDELLLIPLRGHSLGHCGVAIKTDGTWLLHVGDAIIHHRELLAKDQCPIGCKILRNNTKADEKLLIQNRNTIRHLAHNSNIRITNSHDPIMQNGWIPYS